MPYKKNYKSKKTSMAVAKKALRMAQSHRPELKFRDVAYSSTVVSTTGGLIMDFTNIAGGTDVQNRVGESIKLKKLDLRYRCYGNSSSNSSLIRIIVLRVKNQTLGTLPSMVDILETSAPTWLAPYSDNNQAGDTQTYSILYDKLHPMAYIGQPTWSISRHIEIPLHGAKVDYYAGTAGAIRNGGLYVYAISDQAVTLPSVEGFGRLTYVDA